MYREFAKRTKTIIGTVYPLLNYEPEDYGTKGTRPNGNSAVFAVNSLMAEVIKEINLVESLLPTPHSQLHGPEILRHGDDDN